MTKSANIKEYETVGGGKVWLNLSDKHEILRIPDKQELTELLAEFRKRQWMWLKDYLCTPMEGGKMIIGLSASKIKAKPTAEGRERWHTPNTVKISIEAIPEAAWSLLAGVEPLPFSTPTTRLFNAKIDLQHEFLLAALGPSLETAKELLRPDQRDPLIYPWLDKTVSSLKAPDEILNALFERAAFERREITKDERGTFFRKPILDLFLLWLSQHRILLFPVCKTPLIGDARGFDKKLESPEQAATLAAIEKAHAQAASEKHKNWIGPTKTVFRTITTASTFRSANDLSLKMFEHIHAALIKVVDKQIADKLNLIYRTLSTTPSSTNFQVFKPKISAGTKIIDTALRWVHLSTKTSPRSVFPRFFIGPYEPTSNIQYWGDRFSKLLPKLEIKSIGNALTAYQRFLTWMLEAKINAASLKDIRREQINDNKGSSTSPCFRAFLARSGMKPESANGILARLGSSFNDIIEEDRLQIPNPVIFRFDSFKSAATRGKTPRRPMGRELMTFLKELNRKGDYAISRAYGPHQRKILNASGEYESAWFPACAVIVDLLLQLPLRGFQARHLDSGEGDENILVITEDNIEMRPNALPTAQKGRREGVFYSFDNKDAQPTLGIHVNTNKTAVDRVSGYEIAWCSPELRDSLKMMMDWQLRNNPAVSPVPCMEKADFEQVLNQNVVESLKTTYALFRDPADTQGKGWPINRDKLYDYWSLLLSKAENELAQQGKRVTLTVEKEMAKGPNKKPVMKRLAAYDIHTLRVSGISALIEAGLPPDLVRDVAGHSTIVMTLYYNKIKASKLNESIAKAVEKMSESIDGVNGMEASDFELLSSFLINNRAQEDAAGLAALTERMGHGDGSVEIMVHGICPGGECSTGGKFANQAVGYTAVPRPLACSLCRYRLTGPMFLPGLALNANRLMHELRRKGKEIADISIERETLEDSGKPAHAIKARIEALYRETDIVAAEWAAEVQYVQKAEEMFESFIAAQKTPTGSTLPALVTGTDEISLNSKLERRTEFTLLQTLAEGAGSWVGFKPDGALEDHREFLNEVLAASNLDPFLLKLKGSLRDKAALLLGKAITALVPEEKIESLRDGGQKIEEYPALSDFLEQLQEQSQHSKSLDETTLIAAITNNKDLKNG